MFHRSFGPLAVTLCLAAALPAFSQSPSLDYNDYYRFPVSLGVEYQALTPLQDYDGDYTVFDVSSVLRYPLPSASLIQPYVRGGATRFDSSDPDFPDKWDHMLYYGTLGVAYANRFTRNFEIGADLEAGVAEAVFPNAVDTGTVGSLNVLVSAGARISLDPSYGLSIDIHPGVRYLRSLSALDKYDGFLLGLGFAASFRFGEDPDSARAILRNLRFDQASVSPVFGAMQSYYVKNPIGRVKLTNTTRSTLTDVQVSFLQTGYMDSATVCARLGEMKPGATVEVPLIASFNQQVFTTNGVTPLTGEVIATYSIKGRPAEQRESVTYDLYDKTAIAWDDDRKVGAFITPADSALQNYVSFVRQSLKDTTLPQVNEPLQLAMQLFAALGELGVIYQADPASPFTKVQGNALAVDSVKLPRDTLKRTTGDCDDLTVLFCSLLESAGVETGFVTVPGHIYAAVNTGQPSRRFRELNPDRNSFIDVDGALWVPVEITMIGRGDFPAAWRQGSELWRTYDNDATKRGFYRTREAQAMYRPVGLRESDLGLQYGRPEGIARRFRADIGKVADAVTQDIAAEARRTGAKEDYNRLGLVCAQFSRYDEAERYFGQAAQMDRTYLAPRVNLGNISYLRRDYGGAVRAYTSALDALRQRGQDKSATAVAVLLNLSKASYDMERFPDAQAYFSQARELNPDSAKEFAYLATGAGARAGDAGAAAGRVSFIEE
jgi:tetratricopeptide (TPR) repeat protein